MRALPMTIATKLLLRDRDAARRNFSRLRSVNHEVGTPGTNLYAGQPAATFCGETLTASLP
jgi:hypothetical protein